MTFYTLFAETAVTANANAQALAREQFWGTMIGLLIFLGIALGLITWFLHDQQNAITTLFAKSIDANAKLSEAIDKLGDETAAANEKLQLYLDKNLDKIADAIKAIDRDLKDHQNRIESLERGPNIHVAEPISDEYVRPN
ncbi:MAG: hypothetical protein IKE69_08165 [Thermoguttaceae bacterium]|nr:hypothetical protein [Thermoguttaceae bacterium]